MKRPVIPQPTPYTRGSLTPHPALEAWLLTAAIGALAIGFLLIRITQLESEIADLRHDMSHAPTRATLLAGE